MLFSRRAPPLSPPLWGSTTLVYSPLGNVGYNPHLNKNLFKNNQKEVKV